MKRLIAILFLAVSLNATSQTYIQYTTTESEEWKQSRLSLSNKAANEPALTITGKERGHEFLAWGTCFNELGLDALELLKPE